MSARSALGVSLLVALAAAMAAASVDRGPARTRAASATLPEGAGREIAQRWCVNCHSAMLVTQQAKDSTAWVKTVTQMEKWGVSLSPAEQDTLVVYLAGHFGRSRTP